MISDGFCVRDDGDDEMRAMRTAGLLGFFFFCERGEKIVKRGERVEFAGCWWLLMAAPLS